MTRKDDKGDQPSGGETTWANTGATRYGRGQHKTGQFGDDMLRPSPIHRTQRLPNDDDGDDIKPSSFIVLPKWRLLLPCPGYNSQALRVCINISQNGIFFANQLITLRMPRFKCGLCHKNVYAPIGRCWHAGDLLHV